MLCFLRIPSLRIRRSGAELRFAAHVPHPDCTMVLHDAYMLDTPHALLFSAHIRPGAGNHLLIGQFPRPRRRRVARWNTGLLRHRSRHDGIHIHSQNNRVDAQSRIRKRERKELHHQQRRNTEILQCRDSILGLPCSHGMHLHTASISFPDQSVPSHRS
jgi:hypothetical protein